MWRSNIVPPMKGNMQGWEISQILSITYLPQVVQSQSSRTKEIFFKSTTFPRKWNKPVMVTTQLSNSGEVHFWYEVIHDIHKQVSSFLFRRRRSSKETLSFASQKRLPIPSPQNKQLKRRWGHYFFLPLPLPAIFCYILPMQVLMSQMLSKRLKVNVILLHCQ